jgi:hypothetical protein
MNKRPKPGERALTLNNVPDSLLAEYGFHRGAVPAVSYRCSGCGPGSTWGSGRPGWPKAQRAIDTRSFA